MVEQNVQKLEINCASCGTRFRLTSKSGRAPTGMMPCPRCKQNISLEDVEKSLETVNITQLFGHPAPPPDQVEPPRRVFTDITQIVSALDRSAAAAEPSTAAASSSAKTQTTTPVEPTKPRFSFTPVAALDTNTTIEREVALSDLALPDAPKTHVSSDESDDILSAPVGHLFAESSPHRAVPKIESADPFDFSDAFFTDEEPAIGGPAGLTAEGGESTSIEPKLSKAMLRQRLKRLTRTPESRPPLPSQLEPTSQPPPAQDSAERIRPSMFSDEALRRGIELRTDGAVFSNMSLADIAHVLQRGAWPGAIEVLDPSGAWVALSLHPVLTRVEAELAAQTRATLDNWSVRPSPEGSTGAAPPSPEPPQLVQEPDPLFVEVPATIPEPQRAAEAPALTPDVKPLPTALPTKAAKTPRRWPWFMGLTFLAAAALASFVAFQQWKPTKTASPATAAPTAPLEAIQFATLMETRANAIASAIAALRAESTDELATRVDAMIARKNYGDAWEIIDELRTREPTNKAWALREVEISIGSQEWSGARRQAITAMTRFSDPQLLELYQRAVANDPRLTERPITLSLSSDFDTIRALGGGRSVSLKMKRGDQTVYAFKPAQAEWGDGWRSEVAAWRLCELTNCGFEIPWSRPSRISREDLDALYPMDTEKQRSYAQRFSELTWILEPGPDGIEREYLYGVLKTWVRHFADWPIEYTHIWEPWLHADPAPPDLTRPLSETMRGMMLYKDGEYLRNILREDDGGPTRDIAAQLSNILVFDYLTNNWDRFSVQEQYYGVNNQFSSGHFVSIDNGATFQIQVSSRVDARFEPVSRFSKSMIQGLKLLQPSWVDPILFEDATDLEKQKLAIFWQRRDAVLGRVTELVEQYGDQNVLSFD